MNKKFTRHIFTILFACMFSIGLSANTSDLADDIVGTYVGKLNIDVSAVGKQPIGSVIVTIPDQIILNKGTEADKVTILLKNFSFSGLPLGDIHVENIPVTKNGEQYHFVSETVTIDLIVGPAEVKVTGSIGKTADIAIDVFAADADIPVTFSGNKAFEGLRLSDIKINGVTVDSFNSDVFNYGNLTIADGSEVVTYTKVDAESKVNVVMDGHWVYLEVTKNGIDKNRYQLAQSEFTESIKKITLTENIDGNLYLANESEVIGNITVAGSITYKKAIDGENWNVVGLPYIPTMKAVKPDESVVNATAYLYTYNNNAEPEKLNNTASAFITKLTDNTDATALELISPSGSETEPNYNIQVNPNTYIVLTNATMHKITVSEFASGMNTYYTFNGEKFTQVPASTEIAPATMYIAYTGGGVAAIEIDVPNPDINGIEENNSINEVKVYTANQQVYIKNYIGTVSVYALNGAKVYESKIQEEKSFGLDKGTYIVQTGEKATIIIVK